MMQGDQALDPALVRKIRATFVFDLPLEPAIDGSVSPAAFLDREVRELLRLVRFTSQGRPVHIDGYITVMDEARHDLSPSAGSGTGGGSGAVR